MCKFIIWWALWGLWMGRTELEGKQFSSLYCVAFHTRSGGELDEEPESESDGYETRDSRRLRFSVTSSRY
jgi:hypothetical protein